MWQGLGGACAFDFFGASLRGRTSVVVLIEPSKLALARAEAVYNCYCSDALIIPVIKNINEIELNDLSHWDGALTLHLFSNVLDIDQFCYSTLASKMFCCKGAHTILAVSYDSVKMGGAKRFHGFRSSIEDLDGVVVCDSRVESLGISSGDPMIFLHMRIEV